MVEYIMEDYAAFGAELVFPNVQSCCAVIVAQKHAGNIGGYHLTIATANVELDGALAYLNANVPNIDYVCLVGNVKGRSAITNRPGMDYAAPLKTTINTALNLNANIYYHDHGNNYPGAAVRVFRDPINNKLRIYYSGHGNWNAAASVALDPNMVKIKHDGSQARPPLPISTCAINAEAKLNLTGLSGMKSF